MSEQPNSPAAESVPATAETPAVDVTPVAVPDTSKPADAPAPVVEDEPEAAVFRAATDDTAPADAPADPATAPAPDSVPAPTDSGSVVVASDGTANGVNDETARKVDEIHAIAVEVSDFVKNLAPVFEDIQRNGLGSLLGGLFGGRR